jgi:PhnB protein
MKLATYLNFEGQCKAAFEYYAEHLGGQLEGMMTFADSPMAEEATPENRDQIMHACMSIDGQLLMGSDCPPEYFEKQQGISVMLGVDSVPEAERIFNALAVNGEIKMPLAETFWAERFGMVTDQFGTPWMINCEGAQNNCADQQK